MAKVELPERLRVAEPEVVTGPVTSRRRWSFRLLLLAFAVLALLPTALSIFGAVPELLKRVSPQLADALQFRTISLHWWAPVEVTDLQLRDLSPPDGADAEPAPGRSTTAADVPALEGTPLLRVSRIRTREPLWKIVANLGAGTSLELQQPQILLVADESGTNLQRTLTALSGGSAETSDQVFPFCVTIRNGTVLFLAPKRPSESDAAVSPATMAKRSTPLAVTHVTEIDARFSTLDSHRPFPELQFSARITGPVSSDQADALVPPASPGGTPVLVRIVPSGEKLERQAVRVSARELDLRLLQPLLHGTAAAHVTCDGIVSCDLEAELAGRCLADGMAGRLQLTGQRIRVRCREWRAGEWLQSSEVMASGAIALARDGVLLDQMAIRTDFLEFRGSGEARYAPAAAAAGPMIASDNPETVRNEAQITGELDLARIFAQIPRTLGVPEDVVLKSGRLKFDATADLAAISPETTSHFPADDPRGRHNPRWQGTLQNSRLEFVRGGRPAVLGAQVRLDAVGPFLPRPEMSQLRITADFGSLDCTRADGGLQIVGTIQPEKVWEWLHPVFEIPRPGISGDVNLRTHLTVSADSLKIADLEISGKDLRAGSSGMRIDFRRPLSSMLAGDFHIAGSGAAFRTMAAPWHAATWLSETSAVAVDLEAAESRHVQLRAVVQPQQVGSGERPRIRPVSRQSALPGTLIIDEASADVQLTADSSAGTLKIHRGLLTLPGLSSAVSGSVAGTADCMELDLTADTRYDLTVLCSRLLSSSPFVRLTGTGQDVFRIVGSPSLLRAVVSQPAGATGQQPRSLGPTPLQMTGGVSWESANLWGLRLGSSSARAVLENGLLKTQPINCSLNSGEVSIMPQYDLSAMRLQLATGSRVEQVDLSQEMCRAWLTYLAPLLGDASSVNAVVSARVERFDYHLNAPEQSEITAVVTIHSAEASPGPSLMPLLQGIDAIRRVSGSDRGSVVQSLVLPAQEIPFEVRQGLVSHQGLTMDLAGYRIRSSGSVGLDRRIQLELEIPLEKHRAGAESRAVRVPIRGTIEQPLPDTGNMLQTFGAQALEKKLNQQLDRQLNRILDKL